MRSEARRVRELRASAGLREGFPSADRSLACAAAEEGPVDGDAPLPAAVEGLTGVKPVCLGAALAVPEATLPTPAAAAAAAEMTPPSSSA